MYKEEKTKQKNSAHCMSREVKLVKYCINDYSSWL